MWPKLRCATISGLIILLAIAVSVPAGWAQSKRISAAKKSAKGVAGRPGAPDSRAQGGQVLVTGVHSALSRGYFRIILDLSKEAKYELRRGKETEAKDVPPRLYLDILGAQLALASKEPLRINDKLVRQVRVEQYSKDIVRVTLDTQSHTAQNAFMVDDPYRLMIDVAGDLDADRRLASAPSAKTAPASQKNSEPQANASIAPKVTNGLHKIVLDPGHGGKDPGAIGPDGLAEKDIVLSIAKKLAIKLKTEMGIEVVLTRRDDRFVALEDRTALANAEDADLFISLHVNASANPEAKGIETYYLDNTTDEAAIRLAARENATSPKNISDLQFILSDMTQNMKLEDSITLAQRLQAALVSGMEKGLGEVKDLGVKKALFNVLVGARMPSVLVELFFITNRTENRAMSQPGYQDEIVNALYEGIQKYARSGLMARTL